ncbi:MAG: efflux RND transporter periplasmic adaptor subunit [Candidatus Latescibacterota bacterium]
MKFPDFRKFKKRYIIAGSIVLAALVAAGIYFKIAHSDPKIATYKVQRGDFVIDINQSGELDATRSVSVTVPVRMYGNTRVIDIVPDGTMVKEGDFLIQFDTTDAQKNVTDRQNELAQAEADFASNNASIESNMKQLENSFQVQQYTFEQDKLSYELAKYEAQAKRREMELTFKKSELSLAQAKQKIESQKIIDKASVARAELRVTQAKARLKQAQGGLGELTMRSPKSGLVVLREIWGSQGRAKVKVGDSPYAGQELIAIPDLSEMKVKTKVNEVDISRVSKGQSVTVSLDALHGPIFNGKVSSVATLARREGDSEVKVFDVEVIINASDLRLKPGMTAQCNIITGKIPNVISVPLEAVFEKADTTVVYIKKGGFEQRPVKIGSKNSDYVIIENGLAPGMEVALRDPTIRLEDLGKEPPKVKNGSGGSQGSQQNRSQGDRH